MQHSTIGWIGLGTMGLPMAKNLINAGHQLCVYNRTKQKIDALPHEHINVMDTPAQLLQHCDVVFIMVTDDAATQAVCMGENGLLSLLSAKKTIVNMSTISPSLSCKIAEMIAATGSEYIDAPVSGSLKQATEASLVIMAGGNEAAIDSVRPLLSCLGKLTLRVGNYGAGNSAKLAVNTLLAIYAQGLAEAVLFAQKQGIETSDFIEIINNGALANVFSKIKGDSILLNNFNPVFALKHMDKDLRLAQNAGANSPLAITAVQSFSRALHALGEEDVIAIIKHLH